MSNSAAAFANFPTAVRGILLTDTYSPISLHTADLHVLFSGYAAQVTLSLEYVNETNRLVKAIAAYPVPPGFQLQYTTLTGPNRAITDNVYQQSRALKAPGAATSLPTKSLYDIMTSAVATQSVPWDISPGDSVLMTSVYHAPLALIQRQNEIAFTLPTSLFPAVTRPPEAQRNYVKTVSDASSARHVGKPGGLYLTVEGQLYCPLRGAVTLDKGGYLVASADDAVDKLDITYRGDAGFCLRYEGKLPTKAYTQQPLTVHAPIGEVIEPLRLHTVTVPPTETSTGMAAVAATLAPSFANCPVNAELVFLIDVHTADLAQEVSEAVAAAMDPKSSTLPSSIYANVLICSEGHRNGCVALFPSGSVPIATIPHASVLAYMKEEMSLGKSKTKKGSLSSAAIFSPQLPAVLHDVLAGQNVATAVPEGYVRNVILLTDAGGLARATESAAMVSDAANYATNTRVHCVALAHTADHAVLETLAHTAGGRFRCPATSATSNTTAAINGGSNGNAKANKPVSGDLMSAVRQAVAAATVPCLCSTRTTWKLVSKSRNKAASPTTTTTTTTTSPTKALNEMIRLAANDDGKRLPCIPRGTRRVLYGLLYPPTTPATPAATSDQATENGNNNSNSNSEATSPTSADAGPLQLNVRVTGRVGNLALEFTAAALVTRIADVVALAATTSLAAEGAAAAASPGAASPAVTLSPAPEPEERHHNGCVTATVAAPSSTVSNATPQEMSAVAATSTSPVRDSASATSLSASTPTRNGKTLLLHVAAAAARIAFLSHDSHAVTPAEALEMVALSRRCLLPSPYTTLTDGKAPLTAEQKKGGVVFMPSVMAKAQAALAIRTRQEETTAAAVLLASPPKPNGKDKEDRTAEKEKEKEKEKEEKEKLAKSGKKKSASLYSGW